MRIFQIVNRGQHPQALVSLYVVSNQDAALLPGLENAIDYWILAFTRDKRSIYQLLSVEDATDYPFSDEEKAYLENYKNAKLVGVTQTSGTRSENVNGGASLRWFCRIKYVTGTAMADGTD